MELHIGSCVFLPGYGFMLLGMVAAAVLALPRLRPLRPEAPWAAALFLYGAGAGTLAALLALNAGVLSMQHFLGRTLVTGPFSSSFAVLWGGFLGAWLAGRAVRLNAGAVTDALVVPLAAGLAVARLGCLFNPCCVGRWLGGGLPDYFQVLYPFPVYDALALLGAAAWVQRRSARQEGPIPGAATLQFLVVYGVARFCLDFLRPQAPLALGLNLSHWLALAHVIVSAMLYLRTSRSRGRV